MANDKPKDECGVFGICQKGNSYAAHQAYYALISLQHRGQESAGIAVSNEGILSCYKELGLVNDVFDEKLLNVLRGDMALGHVRNCKKEENIVVNAQPLVARYKSGTMAVCLNGRITNAAKIRAAREDEGAIFTTTADSEIISSLIAKHYKTSIEQAVADTMNELEGAYAVGLMTEDKLIGFRDKRGIRPLCVGEVDGGYVIASESGAFDVLDGRLIRDVAPGEIAVITKDGLEFIQTGSFDGHLCSFEFVYFSRPDTEMHGTSVYKARERAGRRLAKDYPVEADVVIGVPDSGSAAAVGYSKQSGIPFRLGFMKNKYIGRTFIVPDQRSRELAVKLKLNPMREVVRGKRVVLIDDSIVRGTTSLQIIRSLKNAGATQVHVRVSSPEVKDVCPFGIDMTVKHDLISSRHGKAEIMRMIGADSLEFLSVDGLLETIRNEEEYCGHCHGCFSGQYPLELE